MKSSSLILVLLLWAFSAFAQRKHTISGYVSDQSGEELIGVTIIIEEINSGATTNIYGYYSITLPAGTYNLKYSYVGYEPYTLKVNLDKDISKNISLSEASEMIEEVRITGVAKDENVSSTEMSTNVLEMKSVEKLPVVFGEPDVIKTIQLLPGVLQASEGSGGFHVRGGGQDQNLVLLDGATVYNPSHFVGFFSVFNSYAIKDLKLYKGGIPAKYGGRMSSVLDIYMKEGSKEEYHGEAGIGVISSKLNLEGPIVKGKSSFLITGRRTYADLFLPFSKDTMVQQSDIYFYDLNMKANYLINQNNRVFASAYFGRDVLKISEFVNMDYGNLTTTLRWNHIFNKKMFLANTLLYTNYLFKVKSTFEVNEFELSSNIKDVKYASDFTYYLNTRNTFKFGAQIIHHDFIVAKIKGFYNESKDFDYKVPNNYSLEYGVYFSNKQTFSDKFEAEYGLRFSLFQNLSGGRTYNFDKSDPDDYKVVDSINHQERWQVINAYDNGFEPRLSLRYSLTPTSSVKASYNRMYQYIQLASNSTATLPLDYWFPASKNVKPQIADQVAVGYFKNFKENMFETSIEFYYKNYQNSIDFRDHAVLLLNEQYEKELRIGDAWAYGVELFAKKKVGQITGWISYTLSRSFKQIDEVNNGEKYPAAYDKPHDVSIVLSYDINKRLNIAANWVYNSPRAITIPTGRFEDNNDIIPVYEENGRNKGRLFSYNRLDLAMNIRLNKVERSFEHFLNISIYNVYNRKNYIMYSFKKDLDTKYDTKLYGTSLYGIVPSISYNVKF